MKATWVKGLSKRSRDPTPRVRDDEQPVTRWRTCVTCLSLPLTLAGRLARADDSIQLDYLASTGCPSEHDFVQQLHTHLPRVRFVSQEESRTLVVRTEQHAGRMLGRLSVRNPSVASDTERIVVGDTCEEVVTSLAFIASIALERDLQTPTKDPVNDASPPDASVSLPTDAGLPPPDAMPPTPPPDLRTNNKPRPPDHWELAAGLDAQLIVGSSPSPFFTLPVFVELSRKTAHLLSPSARLRFSRGESSTHTQYGGADFTWTAGTLDLCPLAWRNSPLRLDTCIRTEAGALAATGTSVVPVYEATRPWFSLGLAARGRSLLAGPLFVEVEGYGAVPFVRDRFFIAPNTTLFRTGPLAFGLSLGAGVTFF